MKRTSVTCISIRSRQYVIRQDDIEETKEKDSDDLVDIQQKFPVEELCTSPNTFNLQNSDSINKDYKIGKCIGVGGYSTVKIV